MVVTPSRNNGGSNGVLREGKLTAHHIIRRLPWNTTRRALVRVTTVNS
jgi:hypothetical protein